MLCFEPLHIFIVIFPKIKLRLHGKKDEEKLHFYYTTLYLTQIRYRVNSLSKIF